MSSSRKRKRITMKLKTPNPLFIKWMTEYRDRAKEEGSKMQFVFNNALESLKKYPLPLENGRDCKILKGFGDKLCKMLDNKLNEHRKKQNGDHLSDTIIGPVHINKESDEINKSDNMPPKCSDLVRKISDDVQPLTRQTKGKKTIQAHTSSSSAVSSQEDNIVLPPDTYDIILYVDTCETAGGSTEIHDDPILSKLRLLSVNCEVKSLKVGDYVWICRDRTTKREFVLPYIIERKRMDDFAQSIKDGRYHEQKFRLKRSGIQNITYLIEKHDNKYVGLPLTTLYQAATNTAIQDGFSVQFTENYKHTAKYLADFSLSLIKMFKAKTCVSCLKENLPELNFEDDLISVMNFEEFNKSSLKNKALKVSDLFVKMLIQIKGMSVERALAIVHEYPTPASLQQAYKQQSSGIDGEKLLANIQFGDSKKNIGLTLSKTVDSEAEMSKLYGKKTKTQKEYVPQEGSGPYAILITLYSESLKNVDYLTKLDLIRLGQHLANASFTKPDPGSRYTAWSSMRTLISKNLVTKKSSPAKFSLTNEGLLLAKKLSDKQKRKVETKDIENDVCIDLSDEDVVPLGYRTKSSQSTAQQINDRTFQKQASSSSTISSDEDVIPLGYRTKSSQSAAQQINDRTFQKQASSSSTISSAQEDDVILSPDSFDIILCVDTSETRGNNINIHDDPILSKLRLLPVKYEVKSLKVGDYIWICRDRTTKKELVLPYIIERKRMDDFAKSIKDGRYHEQKFRLKRSGIQNVTYLIEKYGNSQFFGLPVTTLYQAATNTAIQDGFCIKFTESCKHTAKYLADFSLSLIKMFKSKIVVSCPKENLTEINLTDDLISLMTFNEFNKSSVKNKHMKVSDLFVKMLTQIKGMSVNKALAIVREFPTPATLREAYAQNPGVRGEKLLAQIRLDDYEKTIGPVLSRTVYQLFTMQTF